MSTGNSIRNLGVARENGFFKVEQEADLQRHRRRLVKQGVLEELAGAHLGPRRQMTMQESVNVFEVLPEVLQQQARLDDPDAATRQEVVRRIRGELPRLSLAELQHYRRSTYGLAALHTTPKITFGRDRFHQAFRSADLAAAPGGLAQRSAALSPQAHEVARRSYTAGVRSALYGGALGVAGVTCLGLLVVRVATPQGDPQGEGLRAAVQEWLRPAAEATQGAAEPLRATLQGLFGRGEGAAAGGDRGEAAGREAGFSQTLGDRLHRRYGSGRLAESSGLAAREPLP